MTAPVAAHTPKGSWTPFIAFGLIYTAVIVVVVLIRAESSTDFRDFWENAAHFVETGEIRADLGVHNYLPVFTLLMAPFGLLPLRLAIVLFTLLSLGAFACAVYATERTLRRPGEVTPRLATFLAVGLMLPYITSSAVLGAFGLLLSSLIVLGWVCFERRQEWRTGFLIALAALLKLLPGALLVYFLLKGRWRVLAAAGGTFALVGVGLPLVMLGPQETLRQHRALAESAAAHSARHTIFADKPKKIIGSNNALPTTLRRLLTPIDTQPSDHPEHQPARVNIADWSPANVWGLFIALMVTIAVASIAVTLPRRPGNPTAERAQYGVWCCVALLATPLMWTHYLPLIYWPLAIACYEAETRRRDISRILVIAALVIWLLGALALASPTLRAQGAQIISVAMIWLAMLALAPRSAPAPASA